LQLTCVHCARGDRVEPGIVDVHDAAEEMAMGPLRPR